MTNNDPPNINAFNPLFKPQEFHLKMGLHICEFATHTGSRENFAGNYRYFNFFSLAHLTEGHGIYRTPDGECIEMNTGDAVLTPPGVVHWYSAAPLHFWSEDIVCFTGPVAEHFLAAGIIHPGIFYFGKLRRLLPIIDLARDPAADSQLKANMALLQLLTELHFERNNQSGSRNPRLTELIGAMRQDPAHWWTVEEMAEFCGLNKDYFRRIFLKMTGMSPKAYIDHLKITQAGELLNSSRLTIRQIAKKFGYLDSCHFSRRFKQLTGMSPQAYRDRLGQSGAPET